MKCKYCKRKIELLYFIFGRECNYCIDANSIIQSKRDKKEDIEYERNRAIEVDKSIKVIENRHKERK